MTKPNYLPQGSEIEIFNHAASNKLPVLIKGPTGCGKTHFVEHMAAQLGRPLYTIACHDDLTATDLVGRHLIGENGTYWQDGPLTKAVREGGICYLDEVVEARKDTTVVLHPLSDHRRILPIDRTGEIIEAHPDFMLVISYNPGYQNLMKGLKPSTRQRFVAMEFNYPIAEREVVVIIQETSLDKQTAQQLVALGNDLRRMQDYDLEEAASTRLLIYTALMIQSGLDAKQACMCCLAQPLSDESETIKAIEKLIDCHF
ncbi:CbbQ/NirQ/NorQ/GpvN family protein [Moritella viscosa]|uniref:MoxR-like ATPase n=1 Tax=Moritella viscosa TaxID=80854 RepID=A0A1K9ZT04_9GAMM|nr:CbbQ/NirQ/NorQ/GpvN family protein [Moritella viscosa]SGZ01771.1 MoxR-like ATPase [Moritella viscosa]SGZ08767.1 MoxR-like ATPase [Moritella viscosa]SGZ10349.1 MoxR-like ATPase [Moritella viscosa]SGZ15519.1 MoxR-like ATPase [Moritella viscosa]SGZ16324.1 MoxR-like ATPase [Moritella viscosa]